MPTKRSAPRLLLTAGPTREPIDAVRYLSNRSSGRLGLALAAEAARRGWPVTLLLGPIAHPAPEGSDVKVRRFLTTADLERELAETWPAHDVLVMAAAVADHRPRQRDVKGKLRRDGPLMLELEPTPDLLVGLSTITRPDQLVVAFALEPAERLRADARAKLARKRAHAIVANPLESMDGPEIAGTLLLADGSVREPPGAGLLPKPAFAKWLLDQIETMRANRAQEGRPDGADAPGGPPVRLG